MVALFQEAEEVLGRAEEGLATLLLQNQSPQTCRLGIMDMTGLLLKQSTIIIEFHINCHFK